MRPLKVSFKFSQQLLSAAFIMALFCYSSLSFAQKKNTISGYIKDARNGEALIGASVLVKELKTGASANEYGFYSISAAPGKYTVVFKAIGYGDVEKQIDLSKDVVLTVELSETSRELESVVIEGVKHDANVKSVEMSTNKLDIKTISKIPALLGEVDLVRSIQLLPGVSTVGEGATGFNVRGGGIDQNLVLLDEAPVFNSSHLFGFFSVFNPDAVMDVKLIKGGIPANYGGRLSSILDVRMKEGNNKKLAVTGGIGLIFSRLAIEGPINKGKGSFIVAGRRSYIDILSQPFLSSSLKGSQFYFYDFTAKGNYSFDDKNKLFVSSYFGRDVFGVASLFGFNWGNATATMRWNHIFGEKLFLNTSAIYSNYDYSLNFNNTTGNDNFSLKSKIINYSIKPEFSYFPNSSNTIKFGLQSTFYTFEPGMATTVSNGVSSNFSMDNKYALESGLYLLNEQKLGGRWVLNYGLRLSYYQYLGGDTVYNFNPAAPDTRKTIASDYYAAPGTDVQNYVHLEPRLGIKYDLTENSSIKASYNRMSQNLHLVSNTTASVPLDVWAPSSNNIKSSIADQVAVGYFKNFGPSDMFETSLEGYFKTTQNELEYIDNAQLTFNQRLEGDLLEGQGRAYGAELYVRKAKGKWTGWLSYTLSRAEVLVSGINNNNWFPDRFDRTHNLNLVACYAYNDRIDFSATFVFQTGTPATFPTNRYDLVTNPGGINDGGILVAENANNSRNNARIPPYNRLDLSATFQIHKRPNKKYNSNIVVAIYNVYGRANPFSIYFQQDPNNLQLTQALQFSVIARPIPSVSYNFNF